MLATAWNWESAAEMVALSKELDFAFMAGSSLPTAWRMPPIDMPYGTRPPVRLFTFARPRRQPPASGLRRLSHAPLTWQARRWRRR